MENLKQVGEKAGDAAGFARGYLDYLCKLLKDLDADSVGRVAEELARARREERQVFIIGNGGSAATAMHMVNDLSLGCPPEDGKRFRAVSLTDNISVLTALANDCGYDKVFTIQLENGLKAGDVAVLISASGNSPNVTAAAELAKRKGAATVGFVGFDGGDLARVCDIVVHVRTPQDEYGPVEDIHMVLDHLLTSYFKSRAASDK
ncbi:SIS domain-containing protein [Elusimicrobiota bacterium]